MNESKLKNLISKKACGNSEHSQKLFQMYYFERILDRISVSKYMGQIILKGGLLLSSIIGVDDRTTKDMDATLKGIPLTKEKVVSIFEEILNIDLNDDITFEIISIKDIRLEDEYGGFRLNILAKLGKNKTYLAVELTTGDIITPREMKYYYQCLFEDRKILIMSYSLETVIAEKFHSIVSRGVINTRMKDFYDLYVLLNFKLKDISIDNLILAIINTFRQRGTLFDIKEFKIICEELKNSEVLSQQWKLYQKSNSYAENIKYLDTINAIFNIVFLLEKEEE